MGEFAEGAGGPGVDLEVRWEGEGGGGGEVVESGVVLRYVSRWK